MKTIIEVAILLILIGCNNNKPAVGVKSDSTHNDLTLIPTFETLLPSEEFDSIIFAFIQENPCDDCIYELYIDKLHPTKTLITLKQRVYNIGYLKKTNSLFTVKFHQKAFFVYSGLEDIFIGDKKLMVYKDKSASENVFTEWCIILDLGKWSINKNCMDIPFFPSEPIKFR